MRLLQSLSTNLVVAWARAYTLGLPADARELRLTLIRSDIWEETHDPAGGASSLALLARMARGVVDDVSWRLTASASRPPVAGRPPEPLAAPDHSPRLDGLAAILAGASWAMAVVFLVTPMSNSLAIAGAGLIVVALSGWALELRQVEERASSAWPPALAIGIAALAGGFVFDGGRAGLLVALPCALFATRAWLEGIRARVPVAAFGASPVSGQTIAARLAAGDAIALERPAGQVSRRGVLRLGLWVGLGSAVAAFGAALTDFLWQRTPEKFGGPVVAGALDQFPPGSKTHVVEGKFWLVSLTEEQGGPGFLVLWHKCPHLGCTVPWQENFTFVDPATQEAKKGWFRCPCHQSTYSDTGVRVYGPAPRSMDRMEISFDRDGGRLVVDTGRITKGAPDNARHAFRL